MVSFRSIRELENASLHPDRHSYRSPSSRSLLQRMTSQPELKAPLKRGRLYFAHLGHRGTLGNQLFQIAATIGIARANSLEPVFPEWAYEREFERKLARASIIDESLPTYHEEQFSYAPIQITSSHKIDGYFSQKKYFKGEKNEIISQFMLSYENRLEVDRLFSFYGFPDCAMHVRRATTLITTCSSTLAALSTMSERLANLVDRQRFW